MSTAEEFGRETATVYDFNPNKIAPSLSRVKFEDFKSPD
jgi:hypothetical protein